MGISREYEGPKDNLFLNNRFVEHNHETEHIGDINKLQIDLAMRKYPDIADNDEKMMKWMSNENYSKKFRIILDEELDADQNFWENYKKAEFREALMKRIEEKLYAGEIIGKTVDEESLDDGTIVLNS